MSMKLTIAAVLLLVLAVAPAQAQHRNLSQWEIDQRDAEFQHKIEDEKLDAGHDETNRLMDKYQDQAQDAEEDAN